MSIFRASSLFRLAPLTLAGVGFCGLMACPGDTGTATDSGPNDTFTVGEDVDEAACTRDADCPLNYVCDMVAAQCTIVDNDADNDGFDANVDCDDADAERNPGMPEACNDIDDNCNGVVDEGVKNQCGVCGPVPVEVCDLVDNDCDGEIDEACVGGSVAEVEPNGGALNCQQIVLPPAVGETITLVGSYSPAGDVDSFCFVAPAGTALDFDVDSVVLGAPTDAVTTLFDIGGVPLPDAYNDFADGPDPFLAYTFTEETAVRLDTFHFYADEGDETFTYELKITARSLVSCVDVDGDGLSACDGDCNEADVMVFSGQTETCDGYDNNCDGVIDEECPDFIRTEVEPNEDMVDCDLFTLPFTVDGVIDPRKDKDVFCFFAPGGADVQLDIDAQEPPFDSLLNSRIRLLAVPGEEIVKNDDGVDPETAYMEVDSDSALSFIFTLPGIYAIEVTDESTQAGGSRLTYVLKATPLSLPTCVDMDGDGVSTCEGDCADNDPTVHFGTPEACDDKDNNCDGIGDPASCTGDFDGDGFAGIDGDCDDTDPQRHPDAVEVCDGFDNNCDGFTDEDVKNACGGCGFPPAEICGDNIDNDCDMIVDTDCDTDEDGDLVTPDQGDCDDTNPNVAPGAEELCDGIDNNCNGFIDEYVKNACGLCAPEPVELCDGLDNDCDGVVDDGALNACGDCGPLPPEVCNEMDDNCDGLIDEGVSNACGLCGPLPTEACDQIDNDCNGALDEGCALDADGDLHTPYEGDCDDDDPATYTGAPEVCGDDKDNNCNGTIDDGCPAAAEVEPNQPQTACNNLLWPSRVAGLIDTATDTDFFCVTTTVPDTELGFDIDARDFGSPLDSVLTLYDSAGVQLVTNNNNIDPETQNSTADSYIPYVFAEPGTYVIAVAAFATGDSAGASSTYELEVRALGGCLDLDRDNVSVCEGDCNDFDALTLPGAREICEDGLSQNCSAVADDECVGACLDDLSEPNDTLAGAATLTPGAYPGQQVCGGDPDYLAVQVGPGETLRADVLFTHATGDLNVELLDAQGLPLASAASVTDNETVQVTSAAGGIHYVRVYGATAADASRYELIITVTP